LHRQWYERAKSLVEKDLQAQLLTGILTIKDFDDFGLEHLLTNETKEAIFEPWAAFHAGHKTRKRTTESRTVFELTKDRDYGRTATEDKGDGDLTSKAAAGAAKARHIKRRVPFDNSSYWLSQARRAEEERQRLDEEKQAARELPQTRKDKIKAAFTVNPRRRPLPYNRRNK